MSSEQTSNEEGIVGHPSREMNNNNEEMDIGNVKAPGIFQRAKEEVEAVIDSLHHEKLEDDATPSFWSNIGRMLRSLCGG